MSTNTATQEISFAKGNVVVFGSYDPESLGDNVPIMATGELVVILQEGDEPGSYIICKKEDPDTQDTVFVEELGELVAESVAAMEQQEAKTEDKSAQAAPAKAATTKAAPAAPAKGKGGKAKTEAAPTASENAAKAAANPAATKAVESAKTAAKGKAAPAPAKTEAAPQAHAAKSGTNGKKAAAPAKVETPETPEAVETTPAQISPDTEAVVLAIEESQDAIKAAKKLVERGEMTYFTLGGVLRHIMEHKAFLTITDGKNVPKYQGEKAFEAFVEHELAMKPRTAFYWMRIYRYFSSLGLDEKKISNIGWSKALEIASSQAPKEKAEQLIEYAEDHTREELKSKITEVMVDGSSSGSTSNNVKKVAFKFVLFQDKAETLKQALDAAKATIDKEDVNLALDYIVTEWLSLQNGVEVPLEQAIAHLQAKYGVNLVPASEGDVQAVETEEHATAQA